MVDGVDQHLLAWHEALEQNGIELSVWRIHRKIGMSGGMMARGLLRKTGRGLDPGLVPQVEERHVEASRSVRIGSDRSGGRADCSPA